MWESQLIEQQKQRQAQGPVQCGNLRAYAGGKVADGLYVKKPGILRWLRAFFFGKHHATLSVVSGEGSRQQR